eukprot:TRINITY_DN476_c0_g1_i3.p4 TRINITY_DN476_c0_g1~~TRINITY_DN476_c0_g1_i3.p4  ORF type:complete len:139 (+),score=59.28 TRINITY_DN476_c0_g1_i3:2168-2584(+)
MASPEMKIEEVPEEQSQQEVINTEEATEVTAKDEVDQEEEDRGLVGREAEDQAEERYPAKGEELKEISITGVSALKVEGKGTGPPEKEKKATKPKAAKENKNVGKEAAKGVAAQPANLSIMGSKISSKKGAAGKPKFK